MMKRDDLVVTIYEALIQECINRYPSDSSSFQRDLTRLRKATEKLGHYFYAVEMPRIGNAFRQCFVTKRSAPLRGMEHCKFFSPENSWPRGPQYPLLFSSLWSLIFSLDGDIWQHGPDPWAISILNQFFFCFKKLEGTCDESLFRESVDDFYAQEDRIRPPSLHWSYGSFECNPHLHLIDGERVNTGPVSDDCQPSTGNAIIDPRLPARLQRIADIFAGSLPGFNPEEWPCRHGPGSVADKPRSGDKYDFRVWPDRLNSLFCYDAHATVNASNMRAFENVEHPAKLIAVPKDSRGPRLIASEPSYLQFGQQSINAYLRHMVGSSCIRDSIRFQDQVFSQELAIEASRTGEYATVDLKSASDMLSLWLVERVFRKNRPLLEALYATRSRYISRDGHLQFLKKFAPMGNASVFPLQTIVYTLCSIAAIAVIDGVEVKGRADIRRLSRQVRVFGDDIILPTRAYGCLVQLLTYCGLVVNKSKSYAEGNFREACGVDAYQGYDVTPVYVRRVPDVTLPESIVSTVEVVNNLYSKGYYRAAMALRMRIPSRYANAIKEVHYRSGTFGYRVSNPDTTNYKTRFNKVLQRVEVFCLQPISRVKVTPLEGIRSLLQYITESPSPCEPWQSGHRATLPLRLRGRWVPIGQVS